MRQQKLKCKDFCTEIKKKSWVKTVLARSTSTSDRFNVQHSTEASFERPVRELSIKKSKPIHGRRCVMSLNE